MTLVAGYIVPGRPQPLLVPDQDPGWKRLRQAFDRLRSHIAEQNIELLVLYSTQWPSVIGHQIQADPSPEWVHVDPEFHDLGPMPYAFNIDATFASLYRDKAAARGLHARTVAYRGFPIDTGSIVALKLLNPNNAMSATIVSCNMYADRAETLVLGKAARDAIEAHGKRAALVAVTALSNRMFTDALPPQGDRISSLKDDEWNRKVLQFLAEGRLEDVSQLARQVYKEANADSKLKAVWWLAAAMGQHNGYRGEVLAYEALYGTGGAVVSLTPSGEGAAAQEFDEDDVEVFGGDRKVLGGLEEPGAVSTPSLAPPALSGTVEASVQPAIELDAKQAFVAGEQAAPKPVGPYPHARRSGDLLYLSGVGPRQPQTDEIPGGPVRDAHGNPQNYDIEAQTRAVIDNVRRILEEAGSSLSKVIDVTVFLIDMQRDFATFNRVYAEYFAQVGATRTTVEVRALPTPIAIELKVIARP